MDCITLHSVYYNYGFSLWCLILEQAHCSYKLEMFENYVGKHVFKIMLLLDWLHILWIVLIHTISSLSICGLEKNFHNLHGCFIWLGLKPKCKIAPQRLQNLQSIWRISCKIFKTRIKSQCSFGRFLWLFGHAVIKLHTLHKSCNLCEYMTAWTAK